MSCIITPYFPFPCIAWWKYIIRADEVIFDDTEQFVKMTDRNRYRITGSNNPILLSIPLLHGRNQRTPMNEVLISNSENWQVRHWRSICSVYKRSPYFEYYENSLQKLFLTEHTSLIKFNQETINCVKAQLKLPFTFSVLSQHVETSNETTTIRQNLPDNCANWRNNNLSIASSPKYSQIFEEKNGFIPNLSILDLLFSEGVNAVSYLKL